MFSSALRTHKNMSSHHRESVDSHDYSLTITHLYSIYMQSNKIHNVVLMSKFYSVLKLALHVSDLTGPSSGAFCTSCIRRFGMW